MDVGTSVIKPYTYCPVGTIVCTICRYPVTTVKDYGLFQGIYYHEKQNKNHTIKTNAVDRKRLVKEFEEFINELASDVVSNLSDQDAARQVVTAKLDVRRNYHFCSHDECQKLVVSTSQHKGGHHAKYCKQVREGYASKVWTRNEPTVLDAEFVVYDDNGDVSSLLCKPLRKSIDVQTITPTQSIRSENESLIDMIESKEQEFAAVDLDVQVCVQSEHETNSWIRRVGWDWHLKGLNMGRLLELCAPEKDDEVILKKFIGVFDNLVTSSYELLQTNTNPSGIVRWTMNRNRRHDNSNGVKTTKPFTMVHQETLQKYMLVMHSLICILYRTAVLKQRTTQQQLDAEIPTFSWYGTQEDVLFNFLQYLDPSSNGNIDENYNHICIMKCLNVIVSIFNQKIRAEPYQHVLFSVLSVMGLKADGTFESAVKSKQKFAAIFKIHKLLVYRKSYEEDVTANGSDATRSDIIAILDNNIDQFMTYESNSPISWMYNAFNYATELGNNDFSFPKISWLDNGDTLYCDDVQIKISDLKNVILPNVITELKSMMQKLLLLSDDRSWDSSPPIPNIITDTPNCDRRNYSLLDHIGNQNWIGEGKSFVYKNMCRSYQHLWLENLSANEIVNTKTFSDYEIQRIDFLKLLLFIIHVTSGQPGRGTEVVDIRYANTATLRNLFYDIETKMLYIWSRYHKGYNQSASEKHICRFLPKVVSQLTLRYLWLVLPFTLSIIPVMADVAPC